MYHLLLATAGAALLGASMQAGSPAGSEKISMTVNPARVCAQGGGLSYLNFDLIIKNPTSQELTISEIRGMVFDAKGRLTERRLIWQQSLGLLGVKPAIPAEGKTTIFNPLLFRTAAEGSRLRYEVDFAGQPAATAPLSVTVTPQDCRSKVPMVSPVAGRLLVYDGYDLYSHHRRSSYGPLKDNFQRFGVDLVVVDEQGKLFTGDGARASQWHGWGRPIRASAAGTVAAVHDGQPDNVAMGSLDRWLDRDMKKNPMTSYGNYVLIDHGGGEFTVAGHLRNGSVTVAKGDRVRARQIVGQMGNSGASGGVHLHFERRTGPDLFDSASLPLSFRDISIIGRNPSPPLAIDTGDVILAK